MGRTTNKQRREIQAQSAREKAAAARAAQRRQEQRRRAFAILGSVVAVLVVGGVIAGIVLAGGGKKKPNDVSGNRTTADPAVVSAVTSVKPATFDAVGKGSATAIASKISDPPLTNGGKPELLYVGAEFCPYCAAERWSLATALSRFGTFSNLSQVRAAKSDGNYATLDFYKSSYSSKYLAFTPVENEDRDQKQLEKLTDAQQKIFTKYTTGFPFLYFGGQYVQKNSGYDPQLIGSSTQQQVAANLNDPTNKLTKGIIGEANLLTATICKMTNGQPGNVCTSKTVTQLQSQIGA